MTASVRLTQEEFANLMLYLLWLERAHDRKDPRRLEEAIDDLRRWRIGVETTPRPRDPAPSPEPVTPPEPEADESRPGPMPYRPAAKTVAGVFARLRGGAR